MENIVSKTSIDSTPVPCKGDYLPQYAHRGDAGADLRAVETRIIAPRGRELVATGIHLELPEGYAGLIWPRSGPAVKLGLDKSPSLQPFRLGNPYPVRRPYRPVDHPKSRNGQIYIQRPFK